MNDASLLAYQEQRLRDLPKWLWNYTCRCRGFFPQWFDTDRLMWCCEKCNLPSSLENSLKKIVAQCFSCGNDFVKWAANKDAPFCRECGGNNQAERAQRNINPNIEVDYVNS